MSNTHEEQLKAFACGLAEFYDASIHGEDWWSSYHLDYAVYDVNIHLKDGCLCIDAYPVNVKTGDVVTDEVFNLYNRRLTKRERQLWDAPTDKELSRAYHGVPAP